MESSSEIKVSVRLDMTLEEACWLKCVMQNPLNGQSPEDEELQERKHRLNFFTHLKDMTDNHA